MNYTIELYTAQGLPVASYDDVPLLDVIHAGPDQPDVIRGLLPKEILRLDHTFRIRVLLEGRLFCEGQVRQINPHWSDTEKLILDKYVSFHEVAECEAIDGKEDLNRPVTHAYMNREISVIVKDMINRTTGPLHYTVHHAAFPDGGYREYEKFFARKTEENELETGGISQGQWVGRDRIDFSGAYARDGNTIAGLKVDGQSWPDVRLMMMEAEELTRNSRAIERHPEVTHWTDAQYAAGSYRRKAVAAQEQLDSLIGFRGIDYIELNPHRNTSGAYDDRVDAQGRYRGLVYGGTVCFNAALVEYGLAEVQLWRDGAYLVPEMALKEFYSYSGVHQDSIEATGVLLGAFDVQGGVMESLAALAYAADGFTVRVEPDRTVYFETADSAGRVIFYDPLEVGVQLGSDSRAVCNHLVFSGHPMGNVSNAHFTEGGSIDVLGLRTDTLEYFSVTRLDDAMKFAMGLLNDLAYPETSGAVTFLEGDAAVRVGDLLEFRGGPLRRLDQEIAGEWGGHFSGGGCGGAGGRSAGISRWAVAPSGPGNRGGMGRTLLGEIGGPGAPCSAPFYREARGYHGVFDHPATLRGEPAAFYRAQPALGTQPVCAPAG